MNEHQLKHNEQQRIQKKVQTRHPICLLAHDVELRSNVGSLFRVADAMGIEMLYLSGSSPQPPNIKIRRTSRATEKYVPYTYVDDPLDLINGLKRENYCIISLELTSSSIDIRNLNIATHKKTCLILGAEKHGVCQALLDVSDLSVHVPMFGHNSSMNLVSAASIVIFDIIKRYIDSDSMV